ncbi:hypothetical protein [Proteiniclasticum ruminis]|uniref:Phage endonuclease I n=1 Tax=Proteiniclasticum ruminis TaxID=398199 RepID=A0A1I5BB91_9CLOT|nr:hypothetical protein [Proteiniclasticum ruminis]SFN71988.1 Phage endonuclease I [Proteiniclasticum ruminis]
MRMVIGRVKHDNSYDKYSRFQDKINKKILKGDISKKESAILVTNKIRELYENLDYLPREIINFERLYEMDPDKSNNIIIILSFKYIDQSYFPILDEIESSLTDKYKDENGVSHYIYEFYNLNFKFHENYVPITVMDLTPLKGFFISSRGISIKKPFDLIDHAICYIINDGDGIISARSFGLIEYQKTLPIYYPELKIALRSKLERNMVAILNEYGISWEYEKKHYVINPSKENDAFRLSNMYTPDFELGDNCFIEVKGAWDDKSLYKCSTFIEQYPDFKLITFDELDMYHLDQLLPALDGWTKRSKNSNKYNIKIDKKNLSDSLDWLTVKMKIKIIEQQDKRTRRSKFVVTSSDDRLIGIIEELWSFLLKQQVDRGMVFEGYVKIIETEFIDIQINNITDSEKIKYLIKDINL